MTERIERIPQNELPESEQQSQPSNETDADHRSRLSIRFAEASAIAHAHAERAQTIIKLYQSGGDRTSEREDTPETIIDALQKLTRETSSNPFDFIFKTGQQCGNSWNLLYRLRSEHRDIFLKRSTQEADLKWKIEKQTKEIDEARGLRRISTIFDKRRLERERRIALQNIRQLREEENKKLELNRTLTSLESHLRNQREECALSVIQTEVQAVREEYEKLYDEIIKNGTITREIRDAYIQEVIEPRMSKICDDHPMLAAQRDEFYAVLQTAIENRHVPEEQRPPPWDRFVHLLRTFSDHGGFYGLREYCEPLLGGADEQIIKELLVIRSTEELYPIKVSAQPVLGMGDDMITRFRHALSMGARLVTPPTQRLLGVISYQN